MLGERGPENVRQHRDEGVVHRDLDAVSDPGVLAPQQRDQHAAQPVQRGRDVGDRNSGDRGATVVAKRHAEHAAHRLDREIVGGPLAVWPIAAKRIDRAVDDRGIPPRNLLVPDAEALDDAGTKRLHEHVRFRAELEQALSVSLILEVQHDALLAAIQTAEEHGRRPVCDADLPARIALG